MFWMVFFLISPLKMKKFTSFGFEKEQLTVTSISIIAFFIVPLRRKIF